MSALIKLPCALVVAAAFHVAYTAPSKPSTGERSEVNTFLEDVVMKFGLKVLVYRKLAFWILGAVEIAAITFTTLAPNPDAASFFVKDGGSLYLTPLSAIGMLLIVFGTWLRTECYRAMKSLFTFEVSIRKDHKLITSWPYNMVRHPSYFGMLAIHVGMYCWCGSYGSWVRESGILDTIIGRAAIIALATTEMGVLAGLIGRIPVEDAAMKRAFGKQWILWAHKVPCRLIPGIY